MLSYRTELGGADRVETDHTERAEAECEAERDTKPAASDAVVIFGAVLAVFIGLLLLIFAICQPASCLLARTGRHPSAKPDAREVEGVSLGELFPPAAEPEAEAAAADSDAWLDDFNYVGSRHLLLRITGEV